MSVAIRTATRIQDMDDANVTPAVGVDEYVLTYDHDTAKFVLRAPVAAPDLSGYALLSGRAGGQTLYGGTAANDDITIHGTSNATRATSYVILQPTAGNVGIGTIAPNGVLEAVTQIGADYPLWLTAYASDPVPGIVGRSARGTQATPTATQLNDFLFAFGGRGHTGSAFETNSQALIAMRAAEIHSDTNQGTYMTFGTTPVGSVSRAEVARITSAGLVGIGTTSPATALHVASSATYGLVVDKLVSLGANYTAEGKNEIWGNTTAIRTAAGALIFQLASSELTCYALVNAGTHGVRTPFIRPATDSTTALQLQNAAGTSVLNVDTTNARVGIGTTAPTKQLEVIDNILIHGAGQVSGNGILLSHTGAGNYGISTTNSGSPLAVSSNGLLSLTAATNSNLTLNTSGTGNLAVNINQLYVNSTAGNVGIGTTAPAALLHALSTTATTNAIRNILTLGANVTSTGVGAAGLGAAVLFTMETTTTVDTSAASVQAIIYEATHATRKFDLVGNAYDTAIREGWRVRGNGSAPAIGFLGAVPQARIAHVADPAGGGTVDAEARSAINSILSTLELFGFHAAS